MSRILGFLYGTGAYIFSLAVFLYLIAFLGNLTELFGYHLPVPRTIDGPGINSGIEPFVVNLALLALFGLQHTIMARHGFKQKLRAVIGKKMERPTYLVMTNVLLIILFYFWMPVPALVWNLEGWAAIVMNVGFWGGWALVLMSTFLIDHFELFGLKHAIYQLRDKDMPRYEFVTPFFYKLVRHPLYLGFLLVFWCVPVMTQGHIFMSFVWTLYIFVAINYEERDLATAFGKKYTEYMKSVPMIFPFLKMGKK
jgi:protein-S-isoprenylcysteine O-methyltransferase Ste14